MVVTKVCVWYTAFPPCESNASINIYLKSDAKIRKQKFCLSKTPASEAGVNTKSVPVRIASEIAKSKGNGEMCADMCACYG